MDADGQILDFILAVTHPLIEEQTARELAILRDRTGIGEDAPMGATGYGRKRVGATRATTEITCHARGAYHRTRRAGVLVDMGGQDSKVIKIGASVLQFAPAG